MKKFFSIAMLLLFYLLSFSQKNKKSAFYFWDSVGKAVADEKDAVFFTLVTRVSDTCYQFLNYEIIGPLVSSEEFKDREGKIHHGRSSYMRIDGTLDSTGVFANGKRHGTWLYFNQDGTLINSKQYLMGEFYYKPGEENTNQAEKIEYNPDVQSQFKGGSREWQRYLIQNLRYPSYAQSNKMMGSVKIYFLVDDKGRVQEDIILKSAEFTLDNEARRLIRESPRWQPAEKNGEKVKTYQQQGIQFRLEWASK